MKTLRYVLPALISVLAVGPCVVRAQASVSVPSIALSPSVLAKMLALNSANGHDGDMPAAIAGSLGLGASGQPWPDRQVAVQSKPTGEVHAFAVSRGADGDVVLSLRGPVAISAFRARHDGTFISATQFFPATNLASPLTLSEGKSGFQSECAFWSANIDRLVGPR